jgi:hypothetical protein
MRYAQGVAGLRAEDVLLASFPKSGNTWVKFIFGNVISLAEWNGRIVTWTLLDQTLPELGLDNLLKPWPHKSIPRVVKTHLGFYPLFRPKRSILLIRDPRDVMVSYYHHLTSKRIPVFEGAFRDFIRLERFGLTAWFRHFRSWQYRCTVMIQYEEMLGNDAGVFARLLDRLGILVPPDVVRLAVERSRFEKLRAIEKRYGLSDPGRMKEGFVYTRKGGSKNWQGVFSPEDQEYYDLLRKKFNFKLYP